MTLSRLRHRVGARTRAIGVGLAIVGAGASYYAYLSYQNTRAEAFIAGLQTQDPARYLDELRRLEGFSAFLTAYRSMRGFTQFGPTAPPFLLGRWTVRNAPVRTAPNSRFSLCPRPLVLDYGRISFGEAGGEQTANAEYRLTHDGVLAVQTDSLGTIPIEIVAYGAQINYLTFTPPGQSDPVYAYPCTM